MNTQTYLCRGFRNVKAESMTEAATVFANRQARKRFGRRGFASCVNLHSWSQDGTLGEFGAFVGYSTGLNQTTGHNFSFSVFLK